MRCDIVFGVISGVVLVSLTITEAIKCYQCDNKDSENCKTGECNTAGSCHTTYSLGKIVQKSCGDGEAANDTCQWYGEDAYSCTCKGKDFCNDFIAGQAPPTHPPSPKKAIKCYECEDDKGEDCNTGECTTTGICFMTRNLRRYIRKGCGGDEIANDTECESDIDIYSCKCKGKNFCNGITTPDKAETPPGGKHVSCQLQSGIANNMLIIVAGAISTCLLVL